MNYSLRVVLVPMLGLVIGVVIGLAFGAIQREAKRKNERRQKNGKLSGVWQLVPGSMSRIALFMAVLILIQLGLPMFFNGNAEWIVSGGVVLGYGWMLFKNHRHRVATPQN